MIELKKEERNVLYQLSNEKEDVVLCACIEGNLGRCWVDKKIDPTSAIIIGADFCFLIGVIQNISCIKDAISIISENCKNKVIVTDSISWSSIIEEYYTNSFKKFSRFKTMKEPMFNRDKLNNFIESIDSRYQIQKIDKSIYYKVLEKGWTADFCCFFSTVEQFMEHGMGYVIVHNDEIISGASSYTYCEGSIDITIGTDIEYRRKGLALACASKLILECIDKNIYPRWDAVDLNSIALAEKLGYHLEKEYIVYSI